MCSPRGADRQAAEQWRRPSLATTFTRPWKACIVHAARLKHELRRSSQVVRRVRDFEVSLAHLPDAVNFLDFMTKWVKKAKVDASVAYLQGDVARHAFEASGGDVAAAMLIVAAVGRLLA